MAMSDLRTSLRSCTFSTSYPSSSSISSGSFTTTEPPQPLMQLTRMTSEHIQPHFAHCTSFIGAGLEVHRSTRRNVSSRLRKASRSQGTKVGRFEVEEDREPGLDSFRIELRTDTKSDSSFPDRRTFLMEGLASRRFGTFPLGGSDVEDLEVFSAGVVLDIDSRTR